MEKIKIITDSTLDLPSDIIKEKDILFVDDDLLWTKEQALK